MKNQVSGFEKTIQVQSGGTNLGFLSTHGAAGAVPLARAQVSAQF